MPTVQDKVREHFEEDAVSFDAIYHEDKSALARLGDSLMRRVVVERYELTFARLGDVTGKSCLDVGCGSGRYPLRFAKQGVAGAVGVDFAQNMIDLARRLAAEHGVADTCEFICGDFLAHDFGKKFEIVTAMGFFDYIASPVTFLTKCRELCREKFIASFPKRYEWRVPIRKLRFALRGTPLYFYSRDQVAECLREAGFANCQITNLSRDYFVEAS